jgi:hypothetical protein
MQKLVIAAVAAALALAACGDDSTSSSATLSTTAVSGGDGSDFASLVEKAETSSFRVTYRTSDGTLITIAQDDKGRQSIVDGDSLVISDGANTVSCDGTTPSATCRDLGTLGEQTMDRLAAMWTSVYTGLTSLASSAFDGDTSSDTIAGREATCATVTASALPGALGAVAGRLGRDATATVCVDNETGVLLELSAGSGDDTTVVLVATEFGQPSASDFQPPSAPLPARTVSSTPTSG